MPVFTRSGWPTTIAVMLAAALGSPAFGQELPSRGEVKGPRQASDEPWKASQVQADPSLSSKPPPFTLPPPATPPAAKDAAPTDPAAAKARNGPITCAGVAQGQDALGTSVPAKLTETRYTWYGFVRMDASYDFRPLGSTDDFVTSSIPIPQGKGRNFGMAPRYTRLGF